MTAVRAFQDRGGADGRGLPRAEAVAALEAALRAREAAASSDNGNDDGDGGGSADDDAAYIRHVEVRAARQLLGALAAAA